MISANKKSVMGEIQATLSGFEDIKRYWDNGNNCFAAKILPGEFYVTRNPERIVTVLGSCVSACIRDPYNNIGGMNHFMLPAVSTHMVNDAFAPTRYGNVAMEYLINEILKNGGRKNNLEVKLIGGGQVLFDVANIGEVNIEFVREFVRIEKLNLVSEDLGDIYPRKVHYEPLTGRVFVKRLESTKNNTISERERKYKQELDKKPSTGSVDLF